MAWRDEIAAYAENGDADGALRIFDMLWNDRERFRTLNTAYLSEIAKLKGAKPKGREVTAKVESYDAATAARGALTDALKAWGSL